MSTANYYLDNVNIKDYNVFISASEGLISLPNLKKPMVLDWETEHGEVVDLTKRYYEPRDIRLQCFIKANSEAEFILLSNQFLQLFAQPNTRRLAVTVDSSEPLVYEVYLNAEIDINKKWNRGQMVGTFTISLREPEPVKKVLKFTRTGDDNKTASITMTNSKMINIYWGDGTHAYDVIGTNFLTAKNYTANGTYYIVLTGDIDSISSLTTNCTVVWNKL